MLNKICRNHLTIQDGAKGRFRRLGDEIGGQVEQLFYVQKCLYLDRFSARVANKVNRLGIWDRTYAMTL